MTRVVVVGGGITGLTTAFTLWERHVDVELLEASDRLGGKILTTPVRGTRIDAGPDAFLVRQPYLQDLCAELNLTDELVAPAVGSARLWLRGALRPLPKRQYLGVPLDLDEPALADILSPEGLARARQDLDLADNSPVGDESAGALIRRRLGDEVLERLVGPLLGGINAGSADQLSLQAGVPQLAAAAAEDPSLMRSVPAYLAGLARDPDAPIFQGHRNGMGQVVDALGLRLTGRVQHDQPVRTLSQTDSGWRVHARTDVDAEAVVLTAPAFATADVLRTPAPRTASALDTIDYASVVMVTFAFASRDVPEFDGSGFLIPRSEGLLMSACSWASSKWAHLGEGPTTYLRVSSGRFDDERAMEMDDDALIDQLLTELGWTAGIEAEPREVRITRWPRSLPQYRPGHLERADGIDAMLAEEAPGVFVAGAAYRGLGLPACVHQARVAAQKVMDHLGIEPQEPDGPQQVTRTDPS